MKLFGKSLFDKKTVPKLYDFAQHGILGMAGSYGVGYTQLYTDAQLMDVPPEPKKKLVEKAVPKPTPKELHVLKTLNKPEFAINCDPAYLDAELGTMRLKQDIIGKPKSKKSKGIEVILFEGGQLGYGQQEVASMIERLSNRKRYTKYESVYSEYPYTTNDAIRELLENQEHLEARTVEGMLPDLPKEAVQAIKKYTNTTEQLCGKRPVFYLIAEKEEGKAVQRKRDPILLAQSPYGFFWQILGAWDKEVVFLDEL